MDWIANHLSTLTTPTNLLIKELLDKVTEMK